MDDIHRCFHVPIADAENRGGNRVAFRLGSFDSLLDGDRLLEFPMFEMVHKGELGRNEVSRGTGIDEAASFDIVNENSRDKRSSEPGRVSSRGVGSPVPFEIILFTSSAFFLST